MKIIREIEWSYSSEVFLVEIDSKRFIYKRSDISWINAEKYLQNLQKNNNLPFLVLYDEKDIEENELLIEYISWSKTLAGSDNLFLYEQFWFQLSKIHNISFDRYYWMNNWSKYSLSHKDFILGKIQEWSERVVRKKSDLDENKIQNIIEIVKRLINYNPSNISYVHGDLHSNNVLIRDHELIFFDPWWDMISWDPYRDIALVYIEYYEKADSKKLYAIKSGYNKDLNNEILDYYILLRAFNRYPNPFETNLLQIIEDKISLYS